ncbi:NTP transferase domain-containing protein [Curtobacterium sp. 'Ferrero']|uniref:nucleotidyltransferase family protein n=1 Tax=Curtobacterium sp. 'Ferrero' TaxID=2033654 RepID=UPI0020D0A7FF|nr:nucleotidyltransferase family protein [Curtobacterium sp. 'Ferrero']
MDRVAGLVLAAGQGRRMGRPKALVRTAAGEPWTVRAAQVLMDGGCSDVTVVLGAAAAPARELLADLPAATVVIATDWHRGLSASLLAGLSSLRGREDVTAALVTLVDTPGLPPSAVARVLGAGSVDGATLRRAVHRGRPGHPVLIGRDHWEPLAAVLTGDAGAGPYLRSHRVSAIESGDLWDGEDVDAIERPGVD